MDTAQQSREEFGARVRHYRELRGWDMEDLAERHTRDALERMAERFLSGVLAASTLTTLASALLVAG